MLFYAHLKEGGAIPSRPNTPCRHPGCAALVPYGTKYCDLHKPLHPEENRRLALGRQVCVQQEDRGAESGRLLCDHHGGFQEVPVCGGCGTRKVPSYKLGQIARALNVTVDDLFNKAEKTELDELMSRIHAAVLDVLRDYEVKLK